MIFCCRPIWRFSILFRELLTLWYRYQIKSRELPILSRLEYLAIGGSAFWCFFREKAPNAADNEDLRMNLVKPSVHKSGTHENMPRKSTRDREMIGGCCVCSDERGWDENPLVYCDGQGCNVAVHQGKNTAYFQS